jgi:hypothetical protein
VMLEGLREGRGQFRGAIVIQEAKKLGGERGGRFTALKGGDRTPRGPVSALREGSHLE